MNEGIAPAAAAAAAVGDERRRALLPGPERTEGGREGERVNDTQPSHTDKPYPKVSPCPSSTMCMLPASLPAPLPRKSSSFPCLSSIPPSPSLPPKSNTYRS
jgi:hypothetical protein